MSSRIKLPFKIGDSKKIIDSEVNETSKKEDFSLSEIVRYGFPYRPTTLAYDPVQKILAIGTKTGIIKIYGGAFVECSLPHPTEVEILQLIFRVNEGALISVCRDNYIHLWSLRQKKPVIANSLQFMKDKISRCFLPLAFNSKWLLVGTNQGNVWVVNLDTFTLSSYKIMWNNAIGMGKSTHPGVVVDLCQNPDDPTRLYIGFSTHLSKPNSPPIGHVICWNLQQKTSESVYTLQHGLTSISWQHDGKQFICSHCDGSLTVWNLRTTDKPVSISYPHTRISKDDGHKFGPISKVVWSSIRNSNETFMIFSGGMPAQTDVQQTASNNPTTNATLPKPSAYFLTIVRGQTTNVLHMDNAIIDFHVITPSPHINESSDPSAVVVLLENDLVVIDLKSDNYPLFESLHTLDLHESPVTYCDYITDPNTILYQNLLRLQSKQAPKRTYSQQENPISGGKSGSTIFGYNELILTGHADGSIKFWDASGCNLLFLYKLRTNRLFNPIPSKENHSNTRSSRTNSNTGDEHVQQPVSNELNGHEYPFAIYTIKMCADGRYLVAAGRGGHVTLFKFTGSELEKADEGMGDLSWLEIPILHRNVSGDSNEPNASGNNLNANDLQSVRQSTDKKDFKSLLKLKMGYRRMAGYQPELVCLLSWLPTDKIPLLTDIAVNSKYGLLIFGLENGLVVIDYYSQSILMNMATGDLYGTMDPFQRTSVSPKRRGLSNEGNNDDLTPADYQHCLSAVPSAGPGSSSVFSFTNIGTLSFKNRFKTSPRNITPNENAQPSVFRSRSIDSMSANEQNESHSGGEGSQFDEKPPGSATFAKTFKLLKKRISRTSTSRKKSSTPRTSNQNDNATKSGGDESTAKSGGEDSEGASSVGEEGVLLSSTSVTPTPNPDLPTPEKSTPVPLVGLRSLPSDKTPAIVTSPPPPTTPTMMTMDSNERSDSNASNYENSNLSKTWSASTFTGEQLRGKCSIEYTEHMKEKSHKRKAHVIDLRKDDHHQQQQQQQQQQPQPSPLPPNNQTSSSSNKPLVVDIPRSSSTSSMDTIIINESICAIQFSESFAYKNDFTVLPSVWLGTGTGCVIVINLNINFEPRNISVVPSGSVFRLCGRILHISFLDHKGAMMYPPSEKWDTKKTKPSRQTDGFTQPQDLNTSTVLPGSGVTSSASATTTNVSNNIQYAVFCSSKQARVVALPSQVCIAKQKIYDSLGASATNVLRAAVVKISGSPCLTCYLSGGRIHVYSLPSLRELLTINLDVVSDSYRSLVASTFTFTDRGHGLYMCSPTEIQKFTIASDVKEQINEMLCELYSPSIAMPEAPKPNFIVKFFASNSDIDSDQLFGEAAGKAPSGIAKREDVNANINQMRGKAESASSVVNETRMKLIERGQKLGELDLASKQMSEGAEEFASLTHKIMLKQKEKADWWPFTSKKS